MLFVFRSIRTGLSLKRKFIAGVVIFPFSIRNSPSLREPGLLQGLRITTGCTKSE